MIKKDFNPSDVDMKARVGQMDQAREFLQQSFPPGVNTSSTLDVDTMSKIVETVIWKNCNGEYERNAGHLFEIMNNDGWYHEEKKQEFVELAENCRLICEEDGVDFTAVKNGFLPSYFNEPQGPEDEPSSP